MVSVSPPSSGAWRTSSASGDQNCVEVALRENEVLVRHSKYPRGPVLRFTHGEWAAFLTGAARGEFDLADV